MFKKIKSNIFKYIYKGQYKPGHFYHPVPNQKTIDLHTTFKELESISGIDLNLIKQNNLLAGFLGYVNEFQKYLSSNNKHYNQDNVFFVLSDAFYLYCMIRKYKPNRIIEVGSGNSSALMVDINEIYFNNTIDITFIEPFTDRLASLIDIKEGGINMIENKVQSVSLEVFNDLDENDILFIDSSHVSKFGSDLNYLFFSVIPGLAKGVIIHFHDIIYPFEYPKSWLKQGIYWNEAYMLRNFLAFNKHFEILLFNDFLVQKKMIPTHLQKSFLTASGGSIYLRKIK